MPQMAPLYWVLLFITFLTLFLFSSIKIYFSSSNSVSSNNHKTIKDNNNLILLNWKW